tara:strand:+ start:1390 stop:2433 length:1044 start_codon:yes stop_codon:yes gene_type:complete
MKFFKQLIFILIIFLKTETVFSKNNLFNVNNIQLEKKEKITNNALANQAIKEGFEQLIEKILLKEDKEKISDLDFSSIKRLVTYYQIENISNEQKKVELVNFSVTFDKEKIHDLFYKRGILYSEIVKKELYTLPVLIKNNEMFIFNNNFFYEKWNELNKDNLIEFILPLENIEIIQNLNENKNNLLSIDIEKLFQEYPNKNLALILIESQKTSDKIYIASVIEGKKITKNFKFIKQNLEEKIFNEKIINDIKIELTNLIKSENLIDIRTPSFLNVKLNISKSSNFVELSTRVKKIDLIENIYVQDFNKDFMNLRIKYLGKLDKIINQLKNQNIDLKLINESWIIATL